MDQKPPRRRPASRPISRRWLVRIVASVLVTATLLPIIAYLAMPTLHRWHMLSNLTSEDITLREQALSYVIRYGRQNETVRQAAIDALDTEDDAIFNQLVNALQEIDAWSHPPVPTEPWLRYIATHLDAKNPQAREAAADELAQLTDLAGNPRVLEMLGQLARDEHATVRYGAMLAAARLSRYAARPEPLIQLVFDLAADEEPALAREAWLMVGLLDPVATGTPARISPELPPEVTQAALWAAMTTNPDQLTVAINALAQPELHPVVRGTAVWLIGRTGTGRAQQALALLIHDAPQDTIEQTLPIHAAALRYLPLQPDDPDDQGMRALRALIARLSPDHFQDPARRWIMLTALYRYAGTLRPGEKPDEHVETLIDTHWEARLAFVEGLPPNVLHFEFASKMDDYVRLTLAAVAPNATPAHLEPALAAAAAPNRDLACLIAQQRFSDEQNTRLIVDLLTSLDPDANRGGAILAGLTDLRPTIRYNQEQRDLLALRDEILRFSEQWQRKQVIRLGLWMQQREPDIDKTIHGLLARDDIPVSTILLAMLHRGDRFALDFLLTPGQPETRISLHSLVPENMLQREEDADPREKQTIELIEFLAGRFRWWRVLDRYLPPLSPDIDPHASAWLQQFQLDVLRNWYYLHRDEVTPTFHPGLPPVPTAD